MMKSRKFWWKGEPFIVGSVRYRVVQNDILNAAAALLAEYKRLKKMQERVRFHHS